MTESNEKLIQIRVDGDIKDKCDKLFAKQGLTTQGAIKMLLAQVSNTEKTPFDNLFHHDH